MKIHKIGDGVANGADGAASELESDQWGYYDSCYSAITSISL